MTPKSDKFSNHFKNPFFPDFFAMQDLIYFSFDGKIVPVRNIENLIANSEFIKNLISQESISFAKGKTYPMPFHYTKYHEIAIRIIETDQKSRISGIEDLYHKFFNGKILQGSPDISDIYQLIHAAENLEFQKLTELLNFYSFNFFKLSQISLEFIKEINSCNYSQTIISQIASNFHKLNDEEIKAYAKIPPKYLLLIFQNLSFQETKVQKIDDFIKLVIENAQNHTGDELKYAQELENIIKQRRKTPKEYQQQQGNKQTNSGIEIPKKPGPLSESLDKFIFNYTNFEKNNKSKYISETKEIQEKIKKSKTDNEKLKKDHQKAKDQYDQSLRGESEDDLKQQLASLKREVELLTEISQLQKELKGSEIPKINRNGQQIPETLAKTLDEIDSLKAQIATFSEISEYEKERDDAITQITEFFDVNSNKELDGFYNYMDSSREEAQQIFTQDELEFAQQIISTYEKIKTNRIQSPSHA